MSICGIYLITCTPPGELPLYYVGQSVNVMRRWVRHRYTLKAGTHHNARMRALQRIHGESIFRLDVLEVCGISDLNRLEQWWVDEMFGYRRVLNLAKDVVAPARGYVLSSEARAKISKRRNAVYSADMRKEVSVRLAPYRLLPKSDATKAKQSAAKMGEKNHFFGKSGGLSPVARSVAGKCLATGIMTVFDSISEVRRAGFISNCVSRVCSGQRKSHKNHAWWYTDIIQRSA